MFHPFLLSPTPKHMRSIKSKEGIGDRLRSVAFSELQAEIAFRWAYDHFPHAARSLRQDWLSLAEQEQKHKRWLLERLKHLGEKVEERPVTLKLLPMFTHSRTPLEFSYHMATAERRGLELGEKMANLLKDFDSVSAEIFLTIADEEKLHIQIACRYFPQFLLDS